MKVQTQMLSEAAVMIAAVQLVGLPEGDDELYRYKVAKAAAALNAGLNQTEYKKNDSDLTVGELLSAATAGDSYEAVVVSCTEQSGRGIVNCVVDKFDADTKTWSREEDSPARTHWLNTPLGAAQFADAKALIGHKVRITKKLVEFDGGKKKMKLLVAIEDLGPDSGARGQTHQPAQPAATQASPAPAPQPAAAPQDSGDIPTTGQELVAKAAEIGVSPQSLKTIAQNNGWYTAEAMADPTIVAAIWNKVKDAATTPVAAGNAQQPPF